MMNGDDVVKAPVRELYSAIDAQDWHGLEALVAPDFAAYLGSASAIGLGDWQKRLKAFYTGFPDGQHILDFLSAEGAHIVTIGRFQGTHTGTFLGVAPTQAKVSVGVIHLDRVSKGRIVEHSGQLDAAGLMQQIQAKVP